MKHVFTLAMMTGMVNLSIAQNSYLHYQKAIKLYSQTSYSITEFQTTIDTSGNATVATSKNLRLIQPGIAFQWKAKNNDFHEIELSQLSIDKENSSTELKNFPANTSLLQSGIKTTTTLIAFRYEYIISLRKKAENKMVPMVGFGASPYFKWGKTKPEVSNSFPVSMINTGLQVFVIPRINYYFNSRFYLDVNLPICMSDMGFEHYRVENPGFTKNQQSNGTFDFVSLPKQFSGRIGIGMKL